LLDQLLASAVFWGLMLRMCLDPELRDKTIHLMQEMERDAE
jgi:hypothetical protein